MKKQKSDRIWNGLSLLVLALAAGILGLLLWQIRKLNMLPGNYFLILTGVCLLVTGLLCLLLFRKSRAARILGYLLALILLAGCFVGSRTVARVNETISSITAPMKVNIVLEVYVRADDPAENIEDTAGYRFALPLDIPQTELDPVIQELAQLLQEEPQILWQENTLAQMDALFSGEVDAVVMNSAYLTILEDLEGYGDYASRVKLLHKTVVEKEVSQPKPPVGDKQQDDQSQEAPEQNSFLCYVSGLDNRHNVLSDGRSDVNILVAVNLDTHQILLLSTPRDYYVVNPASTYDALDKLTHCGIYGVGNSMEALRILYGYQPDYYARINFAGFETLVDAIGGVTVYVDSAFMAHGGYYMHEGLNYLNGAQALGFARTRKTLTGAGNTRGKNQMKIIAAIVDQLSASTLLNHYDEILKSLEGMFSTDMPAEEIGRLMQTQIAEMPKWEIFSYEVTGTGASDKCWAAGNAYLYVSYPHEDSVAHAAALMGKVLAGEKLTQEDMALSK